MVEPKGVRSARGTAAEPADHRLLRDQLRALHAYEAVGTVPKPRQRDYKIAVNTFGASLLRNGLSAALASLQRQKGGCEMLLRHLAEAELPGVARAEANEFVSRINHLDADAYMLASRELLKVIAWLKRAAQATFGDG